LSRAPVEQTPDERARRRRFAVAVWPLLAVVLAVAALLSEPFTVHSSSMSPTLREGDQILVEKVTPRLRQLGHGDVVVLTAPSTDALMVKRVVALAGDTVGLEDGHLVVNGHRVREAYVDLASVDGVWFGPKTVPRGAVFVLGDDRAGSVDSRAFGAVPDDRVIGRVLVRLRHAPPLRM
jgi:signal peptidase I